MDNNTSDKTIENNLMSYMLKEEEKVDSKSSNKVIVDSSSNSSVLKKRRSFENDMIEDLSNNLNDSKNYIRKKSRNDLGKVDDFRNTSNYYFSNTSLLADKINENNSGKIKSKFLKNNDAFEFSEEEEILNNKEINKKFDSTNSMVYGIMSSLLNKSLEVENNKGNQHNIPSKFVQNKNENSLNPNTDDTNEFILSNNDNIYQQFNTLNINNNNSNIRNFNNNSNNYSTKIKSINDEFQTSTNFVLSQDINSNKISNNFNNDVVYNPYIQNYHNINKNYYSQFNPYIQQPNFMILPVSYGNLSNPNEINKEMMIPVDYQTIDVIISECKEQKGCRKYQRLLDENPNYSIVIYNNIKNRISELILDQFGNYLIQKLVELLNKQELYEIVCNIEQKIIFIAKNAFGTRVLQKIIAISNNTEINNKIVNQISKYDCLDLILDNNASHVVSALINCVPIKDLTFLYKIFIDSTEIITRNKNGCCVIQKILEKGDSILKRKIVENIVNSLETLILDPFANYVLQCCMAIGYEDLNKKVVSYCSNEFNLYAMNKYSSNVIDKALSHLKIEDRNNYINLAMKDLDFLASLALDLYANHLFQKILLHASSDNKKKIFGVIKKNVQKLKSTQHGEKLLNRIKTNYNISFDEDEMNSEELDSSNFESVNKNNFKNNFSKEIFNASSQMNKINQTLNNKTSNIYGSGSNVHYQNNFNKGENVGGIENTFYLNNLGVNNYQQFYNPYQNINQMGQIGNMNQFYINQYQQPINYNNSTLIKSNIKIYIYMEIISIQT